MCIFVFLLLGEDIVQLLFVGNTHVFYRDITYHMIHFFKSMLIKMLSSILYVKYY